jgi:hypothetical protein
MQLRAKSKFAFSSAPLRAGRDGAQFLVANSLSTSQRLRLNLSRVVPTPSRVTAPKSAHFQLGEELVPACGVDAPHWDPCLLERRHRVEAEEVAHEGERHLRVRSQVLDARVHALGAGRAMGCSPRRTAREKTRPHRADPQAPDTLLSLQRSFEPLVWRSDLRHQIPDQRFFR